MKIDFLVIKISGRLGGGLIMMYGFDCLIGSYGRNQKYIKVKGYLQKIQETDRKLGLSLFLKKQDRKGVRSE